MAIISNPYASQDLFIAKDVSEALVDYVSRSEREFKPFSRQVDAWWLALCIGGQIGRRTPLPDKQVKFNDGGIFGSDPWRIPHLEALALAEEGPKVLDTPSMVIRIATEYANTGFPWLLDVLLGEAEPTLTLLNRVADYM
jgi:hypothetical protein